MDKSDIDATLSTVQMLCQRFGTSILDPDRDKKIMEGWKRLDDHESELLKAIEQLKGVR